MKIRTLCVPDHLCDGTAAPPPAAAGNPLHSSALCVAVRYVMLMLVKLVERTFDELLDVASTSQIH
jgi:hypothetical protein